MSDILPKPLINVIRGFEKLPGIGPKTAARLAYHLLRAPDEVSLDLSESLANLKNGVTFCKQCYNLSDSALCSICSDVSRDSAVLCVVEEPLDLLAIEKSGAFEGLYHVLGGVISPVNGIGPEEIRIKELFDRIQDSDVQEVVLATNPNLEGEATSMYIAQKIEELSSDVKVSSLGRGLPMGSDLEYADSMTLRRSLEARAVL